MDDSSAEINTIQAEPRRLFEDMGSVRCWPLSETERKRVASALPIDRSENILWDRLGNIRSIFADLHRRSQERRSADGHLLKKRRPAAKSSLSDIIKAADELCAALDKAPQDVIGLLCKIDLHSRKSFMVRAGPKRDISFNELELANVTRATAKILAERGEELLPELDKLLGTDRDLADREMAVGMLLRIWTKDFGFPTRLIMHDEKEEGPQPFLLFVEAVLHDVEPGLSFEHAIRNVRNSIKAIDNARR